MDWLVAIVIGAVCGAIAGKLMKSKGSLLRNILLGIIGGSVGKFVLGVLNLKATGFIGEIVAGVIGACILIWLGRLIFKR